ncbi:hypothetical protein [Paenibacillus herberti]|uniref:Uncharacterized protein n=1 Tax=Paenibacillus herberti TaxID=1619309 RepID=A0A229NYK1_9BACL|nr:hypothetical protein [Paenibacillus herberti]OXM14968.1 hypothetical protein CGZ75_19150 [Paenibacillus herberti]
MKTAVFLSIAAFVIGLAFPYLGLIFKIPLIIVVVVMHVAVSSREHEGWRKYLVNYCFLLALIVSYLFKLIFDIG